MRRLTAILTATLLGAAVLAGCGEDGDTAALPADQASQTQESEPTETPQEDAVSAEQEQAIADLADRLGVDASEIEVVSVEDVTWPDGSLGCPEPGKMYTQAMVDGQRIVLAHNGEEHTYHAGGDRAPFHCANPEPGGE